MLSLKGHLLIASPWLLDSFFSKSVVLLLAHSKNGAAGLVINRPTEATVSDLSQAIFKHSFIWDKMISLGGPVAGPLVVLHQDADSADHEVTPGIFSTVEDTRVMEVLRRRLDPSIIAINYAGWGPGQLEKEMELDTWETLPATSDLIFCHSSAELWKSALQEVNSRKLRTLVRIPEIPADPSLN